MTIREEMEYTRRVLSIITAAIFGGGFLAGLIGLVYVIGSLLEQLPQ